MVDVWVCSKDCGNVGGMGRGVNEMKRPERIILEAGQGVHGSLL